MRPARPPRPARVLRRALVVPAACLVAVLTLAGCGDDKDDDAGGTTVPTTAATGTTARPVDTRFTGEGSAEFCALITTFTTGQQNVSPTATPASSKAPSAKL